MVKSYRDKIDQLKKRVKEKDSGNGSYSDQYWKPTIVDNSKTKYKIRILPRTETVTGQPWADRYMHYITAPDGTRIFEPCPSSIGDDCPICEECGKLFNSGNPYDEEKAKERYRKSQHVCNIYIKEDPRDNDAEGNVFMWRYGFTIQTIFEDAIEDDFIFFDPIVGADFHLTIAPKGEYPDYSSSRFARKESQLAETEEEMDEILDMAYNLEEEVLGEDNFKSYSELKQMYNEAFDSNEKDSGSGQSSSSENDFKDDFDEDFDDDLNEDEDLDVDEEFADDGDELDIDKEIEDIEKEFAEEFDE